MRTNNQKEAFALRLRQSMEERGLTQMQLAAQVGVAQSRISEWRAGKAMPQTRVAEQLAEQLFLNVEWLIEGTGLKEPKQKSQYLLATAKRIADKTKDHGFNASQVQKVFEISEAVMREGTGDLGSDWQRRAKEAEERAATAEKHLRDLKRKLLEICDGM